QTLPEGGPPLLLTDALETGPILVEPDAKITPAPHKIAVEATFGAPIVGPGDMFTVPIQVPSTAAPGTLYYLDLTGVTMLDANGNVVPVKVVPGTILVTSASIADMALGVRPTTGRPGAVTVVEIVANDKVKGITGANLAFTFYKATPPTAPNPVLTSEDDVKPGPIAPRDTLVAARAQGSAQVNLALAATTEVRGPGVLLTVPIRVPSKAAQGTVYTLEITGTVVMNGVDVPIKTVPGTLTVRLRERGDVNGDGFVTAADVTMALRILVGLDPVTPEALSAADLNSDGRISVGEIIRMLRATVGLTTLHDQGAGASF
ncbi:MAG: dockerin type I repeat-containing protein, partial [Armatimonadota bacterium]